MTLHRNYIISSIYLTNYEYGFKTNSAGYLESQNKGVNSSYAMIKIRFYAQTSGTFTIYYICNAENNYDYALFSNLNSTLSQSSMSVTSYSNSTK